MAKHGTPPKVVDFQAGSSRQSPGFTYFECNIEAYGEEWIAMILT